MFLYAGTIWDDYAHHLPRHESVSNGQIYPLDIHGIVVFQTKQQKDKLTLFNVGGITTFFCGLAIGGYGQKKYGPQKPTPTLMTPSYILHDERQDQEQARNKL